MSLRRTDAPADRRREDGLLFDAEAGRLELGRHLRDLRPGWTNRDVLLAYVELTARCRGERVSGVIEVRQADVEALAAALDLDAADLAGQIQQVLGATRADAQRLVWKLRDSRVIGGITKAALGGIAAGALVTACGTTGGATDASVAPAPPAPAVTSTTAAPPATEEVRLVPPTSVDAPGSVDAPDADVDPVQLIPPANVDQPG